MKPIIGILGPTAVGKSSLALKLAEDIGTEIISADSMQIYKRFDIGTAKPTAVERQKIRHHLIDIAEPQENFSSYLFKKEAQKVLRDFENRNLIPLIVGGTGFFFKNLLYQFDFEEGENFTEIRARLQKERELYGETYIYSLLQKIDPASAEIIHPNDVKKAMRALEIYYSTGKRKSEGENAQKPLYEYILFVLNKDRQKLYKDIDARVDKMVADGLIDEVKSLYDSVPPGCLALQGIGYKEIISYLNGDITKEEAVALVKQHSRNYAKRQITFFKKMDAIWLDAENNTQEELITTIKSLYESKFYIKI